MNHDFYEDHPKWPVEFHSNQQSRSDPNSHIPKKTLRTGPFNLAELTIGNTLPETNIAPENGWLEDKSFVLGPGLLPGATLVSWECIFWDDFIQQTSHQRCTALRGGKTEIDPQLGLNQVTKLPYDCYVRLLCWYNKLDLDHSRVLLHNTQVLGKSFLRHFPGFFVLWETLKATLKKSTLYFNKNNGIPSNHDLTTYLPKNICQSKKKKSGCQLPTLLRNDKISDEKRVFVHGERTPSQLKTVEPWWQRGCSTLQNWEPDYWDMSPQQ